MKFNFQGVVATASTALDSGIGDTALKTFNGTTYLYSVTGPGGGIAVWTLANGAIPQLQDTQYFSGSITFQVGRGGMPVTLGGQDRLILDVDSATGLVGYDLLADGSIGTLRETGTLSGGGDIGAMTGITVGPVEILAIAHEDSGNIATYHVSADGSLSLTGITAGQADSMQSLKSGSGHFVITADAASNVISTYEIDDTTGILTAVDNSASLSTLGIATPTAIEVVQAYGLSWVLVAGSGSNSLSVMKLGGDGRLTPTDHVLDSLNTRFETVQDLAVVEANGRAFVVAGGGDDGLTLFTLTPDGQLIYLDSFADTLASGLQNVETISVAQVGDELQILAASQQESGLTQLTVSIADLGVVDEGLGTVNGTALGDMLTGSILNSTLLGGAGDDILIAGTGATTMTGGSGADIFVMNYGSDTTTITDFQPGLDRLDLFDYPLMRTPSQLTFTATAQGAQIDYVNETILVHSATGGPLTSADIFGAGFGGPDHIPVNFGNFGGLVPEGSGGVLGDITVDTQTANPALADAEIRFTLNGGGTISVFADENGQFDLGLPSGTFPGQFDVVKSYSTASDQITALDALQVLRISVGLDPTWGPATPENLIAADITQDGTVNALDALAVLQVAVGLPTTHPAEWVFLDSAADLSGITPTNVNYATGTNAVAVDGQFTVDMTSILLGNLEAA